MAPRAISVASPGRAERAREAELRLRLREPRSRDLFPEQLELRGTRPATTLERVPRGDRGQREAGHEMLERHLRELAHVVHHALGRTVLGHLEMGVHEIVERVELIELVPGGV